MKKIFLALFLLATTTAFAQTKGKAPVKKAPVTAKPAVTAKKTLLDTASYGFGLAMAVSLKGAGITSLNYDMMAQALKDSFADKPTLFTPEQAQKAIQDIIASVGKQKYAANIAEGKAFLEKNKTQPGVKTTASGLQYIVLTEGKGIKPGVSDTVNVNYKGTLLNGAHVDSSEDQGGPVTFLLYQVIKGWTEGLQLMSEGSKYRFFIPYNIGYGERGNGERVPPYSTLIFEIELLKVTKEKS